MLTRKHWIWFILGIVILAAMALVIPRLWFATLEEPNNDPLGNDDFNIKNTNDQAVIFITKDGAQNRLTFTIQPTTVAQLELQGGLPVSAPGPGGSSFCFNFESILTPEEVQVLDIQLPDGWQREYFKDASGGPGSWAVAPNKDGVIEKGKPLSFIITNMTCQTSAQPGNFEIFYYNIKKVPDSMFPIPIHLGVINPPDPGKKKLKLDYNFINPVHPIDGQSPPTLSEKKGSPADVTPLIPVYITYDDKFPIKNGFTVYLNNNSKDPLVTPVPTATAPDPVFKISFLFGANDSSLTTQALGDNNIDIAVKADNPWTSQQHLPNTSYWNFYPQSPKILDGHETVKFTVRNIITPTNVNPDTITALYIQYNNIPGYNDGYYTIDLQKKTAAASIDKFTCPINAEYGAPVPLYWETSLARRVTLSYLDRDGNPITLDSLKREVPLTTASGFTIVPQAPKGTNTFTLFVYDFDPDKPANQQPRPITFTQPSAQISDFHAEPPGGGSEGALVDLSKPDPSVILKWTSTNAQGFRLKPQEIPLDKSITFYKTPALDKTTVFTLEANSYEGAPKDKDTRSITVHTYRTGAPVSVGPMGDPNNSMQSLPLILVNKSRQSFYVGNRGANQVFEIDINSGAAKVIGAGNVIALSPDYRKLYIANPQQVPPSITMIDTSTYASSTINLEGPQPNTMIVNKDGTKLFAAAQFKCNTVTVYDIDENNNRISKKCDITVGDSPMALAFNGDESKLYVANYGSASISIIDTNSYTVTKTISLSSSISVTEPHALAFVSQKNKLYAACEGENYVAVIDTNSDQCINNIQVGIRPSALALKPNGSKLYVANLGANTVSIIDTDTDNVKSLTVGQNPGALALNPVGTILYVANYGDKSISVVDTSLVQDDLVAGTIMLNQQGANPFGLGVYSKDWNTTILYVAKEYFNLRLTSSATLGANEVNGDMDVSIFSFIEGGQTRSR